MDREGVQEEIMPENLKDQQWTLDERIIVSQIVVVPDALALERWRVYDNRGESEKKNGQPISPEIARQLG
jgi:hypothetical protein